jgi:hypothetical protein
MGPAVRAALLLLALLAALLLALGSDSMAGVDQRPAAGSPDPRQMVLRSSDLGGAPVTAQRYYRDTDFPSVISYEREFESARVGSTRLLGVNSEAEVGTSAATTASFLRAFERFLGTKAGRRLLTQAITEEAEGLVSRVQVGRPRVLGVGDDSFDLLVTLRVLGIRLDARVAAFRVERVLGLLLTMGEPGERVSRAVSRRLAGIMAARARAELVPRSTGAPVVAGIAEVGQTLTATRGTWRGSPTTFAYQWHRCDGSGVSCVAIPGATGDRYVVDPADVGARIRVAVTARNSLGSATSVSTPTAVVPEITPPVNVAPPTISGTPQVGQTLTAQGAGTWTGNPFEFRFQWLRCDASGGACVSIPGATAGTYVLASGDAGATIRVAVTARNAAGETTAVSAPTAPVT